MSEINTTENLRTWLRSCPSIENDKRFNVDWLGKNAVEYSLFAAPTTIAYGTDILGSIYMKDKQELNYTFAVKFPFSQDIQGNIDNLGFFQEIIAWFIEKNRAKEFPTIAEGRIIDIMPTLSPYVFSADDGTGIYQIQIKIRYRPAQ